MFRTDPFPFQNRPLSDPFLKAVPRGGPEGCAFYKLVLYFDMRVMRRYALAYRMLVMKELRPLTIITVGTALFAVAVAAVLWFAGPEVRRGMGLIESLLLGAAFGLVILGPMAAAQAVRRRHPEWLIRHSFRIRWYTSFAMALSLGYT